MQRFNTGGCNQCLPTGVKAERSLPWKKNEQAARSAFIPCEKTYRGIFPFIRHLSRSPEYTSHSPCQPIESREFNAPRRYERETFFSSFAGFRIENSRFVRCARRGLARYKNRNRSLLSYSATRNKRIFSLAQEGIIKTMSVFFNLLRNTVQPLSGKCLVRNRVSDSARRGHRKLFSI